MAGRKREEAMGEKERGSNGGEEGGGESERKERVRGNEEERM